MTAAVVDQQWEDKAYCDDYASTHDISTDDIHYGWLAPGEACLGLVKDLSWETATVLDLGCGMGENLVAMNSKGATCYGVDISPFMLEYAEKTAKRAASPEDIYLIHEDMRNLGKCFPETSFDLVISVYSMEYLKGTEELRKVLNAIYHRLHPGGLLVFCFSHPLQHFGHCDLRNKSDRTGNSEYAPLIYSFLDVIKCLDDVGFSIDRIVEQVTHNPSTISYANSLQYPYRFHDGQNPCKPEFDYVSNQSPHTCIYRVRKPNEEYLQSQGRFDVTYGTRTLWREARKIADLNGIFAGTSQYYIEEYDKPFDDIVGACEIIDTKIKRDDATDLTQLNILAFKNNRIVDRSIQSNSILGIVHKHLSDRALRPLYYESDFPSTATPERRISEVYIQRIEPIHGKMTSCFPTCYVGLLFFINGEEPGSGKVNLTSFVPKVGDRIQVIYIAGKNKKKRHRIRKQFLLL